MPVTGKDEVTEMKASAIVLLESYIQGLAYGNFSYAGETSEVKLEPFEGNVKDKQNLSIPVWAGIAELVIGSLLMLFENNHG